MCIFRLVAVNSPAAAFQKILFAEPPLYGEFYHGGLQKRRANSDSEHHIFVYINTGRIVPNQMSQGDFRSFLGKKIGGGDNEGQKK